MLKSSGPLIRKHNEKQSQYKTKLRQAKQVFLKTMAQKDNIIQKLENDLLLASSLSLKVSHSMKSPSILTMRWLHQVKHLFCICLPPWWLSGEREDPYRDGGK